VSYSAAIVISSRVSGKQKHQLLLAALSCWPFLRLPVEDDFAEHLLMSPPETSTHLHPTEVTLREAFTLNNQIYENLPAWSVTFPEVTFAMIEAECVSGECHYGGYVCGGGTILQEVISHRNGHILLLNQVGIAAEEQFAPFSRGYFQQGYVVRVKQRQGL
jgi:hypothetical protein